MKIGFILECVDNSTLVLPEFQRGYVWSRDQVKGLMQSLYHGYPVGGLLIWQTRADTTNLRGAEAAGTDVVKLLLDGQQRITSLYGVIRGRSPQFMEDPERANAFTGLHFHLGQESFEFYQPSKMAGDPLWISVTDLMLHGPETVTEALGDVESMSAKTLVSYVNRLQHLYGVRDIEFHDESISGDDMTVDIVVDIFNRVNSGGTKLSKGDLALARICALRSTAREELRATIARWRLAGFEFTLDWLLRCVNAVMTGEAKFDALKSVSAEDFGLGLKRTEHAVDFVLNLLATRLGVDHDRVLIGRYGIPAMVRLVVDHGGSLTNTQQQNDLLYWFIHQAAWGRYSGSTETVLDRDLAAIETGGVEGLIRELSLWRGSLVVRPEDFETQTVSSRFYPVLYMLTRVNDASDFCSGLPLSSHLLGKGSRLEVHHLFPKGILYAADYERKDVNAVANFAFLTGECNRKLGMSTPTDYFPKVEGAHPGVLASQWISSDPRLWQVENYPEFLADRRARLASAANALLEGLRAGDRPDDVRGTAAEVVEESQRDDRLRLLSNWCASLGLARADVPAEITDPDTGEVLVYADAAWSEGMQVGRTEKVALLLTPDEESEARLGELGYRFFTSEQALRHYVEELLNVDLDDDGTIGAPEGSGRGKTWYVNFGDGRGRNWEDARRYGFVSAGGGVVYSKPLRRVAPGDRLLVYLPGKGFAGIGTATRRAVPFDDAVIDGGNGPERLADLDLLGPYVHPAAADDPREFVVSVDWLVTVDKQQAYRDPELFSNQATTVEMQSDSDRHVRTVKAVVERLHA